MMTEALAGELFGKTNPAQPLDPDDPRNLDIDAQSSDGEPLRVRGENWASLLARIVSRSPEPVFELFTGLPGSGKSTELMRLRKRLEAGGHTCVLINADEAIDVTAPVNVADLLIVIVQHCERRVLALEGKSPDKAVEDSWSTRLWHWLTRTDVELKSMEAGVSDVGSLSLELKTRPTLRQKVRAAVSTHLTSFIDEIHREIESLQNRAKARNSKGLVVIFDSLEKLRGTSTTQEAVQQSAEETFYAGRDYLRLPVHVIFTVPTYLRQRAPMVEVRFMPMIKLRTRDGQPFAPAFEVARDLVRRRISDEQLRELLGTEAERLIHRIIEASGGFPRDILRPLHELLLSERFPVSERDVDRALNRLRDAMHSALLGSDYRLLARVAVTRSLDVETEEERMVAARLLSTNVLLHYLNDSGWYDVHPLAKQIPTLKEAIRTEEQETGAHA